MLLLPLVVTALLAPALAYYPEAGLALALQLDTDDPALRAGFTDDWVEALAAVLVGGD